MLVQSLFLHVRELLVPSAVLYVTGYEFSPCPPASPVQSVDDLWLSCHLSVGPAGLLAFGPYFRTCLQLYLLRAAHRVNKVRPEYLYPTYLLGTAQNGSGEFPNY